MSLHLRNDNVLLDIKGVGLSFGNKMILRDVNAQIKDIEDDGQIVAFLGPSGIGKTQLSRIIAGLQIPTKGQVLLKDGRSTGPGEVCMVPQTYPLFDYETVAGNLYISGKMAGLSKNDINNKATQYIEAFGLKSYLTSYPRELSGGTRQRVAIARQLMCASNYMVMDEPFSGLDPIMKKAACDAIVKLASLDTYNTIIIVTHDILEGLSVADTVWLMGYPPNNDSTVPRGMNGATIVKQYDLGEMGFAWRQDLSHDAVFLEFVNEVKDEFQHLK